MLTIGGAARPLHAETEPPEDALATRKALTHALQDVRRQYGQDAVFMEGQLLSQAIRSGSMLETAIAVSGVEKRAGKRFLAFKLDTGIIYNDREMTAPARVARAWSDIVESTLRSFRTISFPADGVAVLLTYTHKPYADEADLHAHLSEGHGEPEAVAFYLLLTDVTDLLAERITAQELVDRSTVLVNGLPSHPRLGPRTSPTP